MSSGYIVILVLARHVYRRTGEKACMMEEVMLLSSRRQLLKNIYGLSGGFVVHHPSWMYGGEMLNHDGGGNNEQEHRKFPFFNLFLFHI